MAGCLARMFGGEIPHVLGTVIKNTCLIVIASLRLEKTSKIIKSNHQPNTTMPAKPCPEVPYLHIF